MHVNEAHNGYLEVYLNLGWVGVGLIGLILMKGYSNVVTAFRFDPPVAVYCWPISLQPHSIALAKLASGC